MLKPTIFYYMRYLQLFIFLISLLLENIFSAPITTITDILPQTTSTFFTPPTQTSTFYITSTPANSVRILTITAIPSTSIVVSVTVANINKGRGSKLPDFIVNNTICSSTK